MDFAALTQVFTACLVYLLSVLVCLLRCLRDLNEGIKNLSVA
jgi:hypothetical protein